MPGSELGDALQTPVPVTLSRLHAAEGQKSQRFKSLVDAAGKLHDAANTVTYRGTVTFRNLMNTPTKFQE